MLENISYVYSLHEQKKRETSFAHVHINSITPYDRNDNYPFKVSGARVMNEILTFK